MPMINRPPTAPSPASAPRARRGTSSGWRARSGRWLRLAALSTAGLATLVSPWAYRDARA